MVLQLFYLRKTREGLKTAVFVLFVVFLFGCQIQDELEEDSVVQLISKTFWSNIPLDDELKTTLDNFPHTIKSTEYSRRNQSISRSGSPAIIVLPDDSICSHGHVAKFYQYVCNGDTEDFMGMSNSTFGNHHLLYRRPSDQGIAFGDGYDVAATVSSFSTNAGFNCVPKLHLEWQIDDLPTYQCVNQDNEVMRLAGDLEGDLANGRWQIQGIQVNRIQLAYAHYPVAEKTFFDVPKVKRFIEFALQEHAYQLEWEGEFESENIGYLSRIYFGPLSASGVPFGLLVIYENNGEKLSRLVGWEPINKNSGIIEPYELDGNIESGWHDLNADGLPELALLIEHGGTRCCAPLAIFQMKHGQLLRLDQQVELLERNVLRRLEDIDEDGVAEIVAFDTEYALLGGCNACGFTTDVIYRWNGETFVENSAEFPDYYLSKIAALEQTVTQSVLQAPHKLVEILVLRERIGQGDLGWQYLNKYWNHERFDEFYGQYFDLLAEPYD